MSRSPIFTRCTVSLLSLAVSIATAQTQTPITGATFSNGGDHLDNGDTSVPLSFTSLTAGGETYTNFFYGTTTVLPSSSSRVPVYPVNGTIPTKVDAITNDIINDGLLNTREGTKIMFDVAFTESNRLFITDLQISSDIGGDNLGLYLLDVNGDRVGTGYPFAIGSGGTNLLTYDVHREGGSDIVNARLYGSVLSLSDFGYTELTAVRGIEFGSTGNDTFDPMSVGLTQVPEPGSLALMGIAALVGLLFYHRR
ncbi:MAG: PEP-CTERM sorting domain-containing protein [Kiritimatiellae bacterium]|jgi:hypothetical protein|nr:PEP-CTERM sorting domain-containing protein [Kiritimatiellia bacterium]